MVKELDRLETTVRRYQDAKVALESLTPIPPGARELLQAYVNDYDVRWSSGTRLTSVQNRMPGLHKAIAKLREQIRQASYIRPVS
jgi:type VI protein secretion system component VasK